MIRRAADFVEVEAVFAHGVFTPSTPVTLHEGQRVVLSIEMMEDRPNGDASLQDWNAVFEGLSDRDVDEIEPLILDRSSFFPDRTNGA